MALLLPEKDYFTRKELSIRWECESDLVDYYITNGDLREAFHSTSACFFGLQTTQYYKCEKQSKLFQKYYGCESFELQIDDLFKQLGMGEFDYFGCDAAYCPTFIYVNLDERMIWDYPLGMIPGEKPIPEDGWHGVAPAFGYLSGIGNDRYIPIDADTGRLRYDESMKEFLVIPKEERDRFESLHSCPDGITAEDIAAYDIAAHEAAEGPLPERGSSKTHYMECMRGYSRNHNESEHIDQVNDADAVNTSNIEISDPTNTDHAEDLAVAIAAWNYLYRDNNKQEEHSHSRAFDIWAKTNAESLSPTAKNRIKAVCNPTKNKNDGNFPEKES